MVRAEVHQQRLALLTSILLWEGRLNNARLRGIFDLSSVRASEWIREFRETYPGWTEWNSKTRSYHATMKAYRPDASGGQHKLSDATSLSQYLGLVGIPHSVTEPSESRAIWAAFPDLSVPSPRTFALVSEAIRERQTLRITYRSMREPTPHQRVIAPHSLIRAGRRWHLRAFSSTNQDFRDYALGRVEKVERLASPAERTEKDDRAWMTKVPVRLVAHPDLTPEQEAIIRFEYFNNTSARVDTCRGALVSYFIQDIRAAIDPAKQRPPDFQMAVANIKEVRPWLFPS